jgi:repressor LexA
VNYTPKQLNILQFLYRYQEEHGFSPTYAEIAKELSVSTITVFEHLQALEKKKAIRRRRHEARSVEVLDRSFLQGRTSRSLAVRGVFSQNEPLGQVAPGTEIFVGEVFNALGECFALKVKGDGLLVVHICDGDYLVFESTTVATENSLVLAFQEGGKAVLRRFVKSNGVERLEALDPSAPPPEGRAAIQAVCKGAVRKY